MKIFKESLAEYLYAPNSFQLFDQAHILSILLFLLLAVSLPLIAKQYLNNRQQQLLGSTMGWIVTLSYLSWMMLEIFAETFSIKEHLPFHLCRTANLAMPLIMSRRNYPIFEIIFFWGLSGAFQSMLTPDVTHGFPHYHFFRYWISHHFMIVALIYAVVVYGMKPTWKSLWKAFIALNLFFLITIPVNLLLQANYFWICGKPETPSLLDYMGPHPWYILTGEIVALLHFLVVFLPFKWKGERSKVVREISNR
ncbi:MAG: TIGR02206 family membrane protein [Fidelibacterota bacterium]